MKSEKKILREKYREIRDNIPEKEEKNRVIREKFLSRPEIEKAKAVFIYLSFGSEVDTIALTEELLKRGKKVAVPLCESRGIMRAIEIKSLDEVKTGKYGILEPLGRCEVLKDEIDVCIIPALAFDNDGYRLGYGGGYYDRFLEDFGGIKIGLGFSACIAEKLPREENDIPVDRVITEER